MTTTKTASRPSALVSAPAATLTAPHAFKGKLAVVRNAALAGVATLAYTEGKARADTIAQLKIAIGIKPTDADIEALKLEYIVGRVAFKLADMSKPIAEQIAFARAIVTQYAAPPKEGTKARDLRAGQLGRRTPEQHKAVRASEEAWSQVKADLGIGTAQTPAQRKAAAKTKASTKTTRGASASQTNVAKGVTHSELVKPDGPMTPEAACAYVMSMATTLGMFANKHAAVLPASYGSAIVRFRGAVDQIAKDMEEQRNAKG